VVFVAGAWPLSSSLFSKRGQKELDHAKYERPRLMCKYCAKWDAVPHPAKGLRLLKPFVFNAIALKKHPVKVLIELLQKLMGLRAKP
jgi:hypothetical protein